MVSLVSYHCVFFPRALQVSPDTSWKSSSSDSSSTRIITSQSSPTWNILTLEENNSNALKVIVGYILFTCPCQRKESTVALQTIWSSKCHWCCFHERERVGCWCLGTRRTQQQQDGRWSDHQSLCNNRGRAVVDKSTKSAFSGILGDHILWKPQIFSQIFADTSKWSFIKTSLVPPMMIRPPVTMPAPRASVCCTTSAFQSKFYSFAATQTGIENIHNLLSYPFK